LRFLLQEFDLPRGESFLGRSSECQVTIEDPLVSRQHAKIHHDGEEAIIEDLGSRNGVRVNGQRVKGTQKLKDGDRIRIGTQELVFCRFEPAAQQSPAKTTGFLRHCSSCRLPYPREVVACPNCGAVDDASRAHVEEDQPSEEETLSGTFGSAGQAAWSLQLLIEVLEKALTMGRQADVERILRRATAQIEERIGSGDVVEPKQLEALSVAAAKASLDSGEPTWGSWVAEIHRRTSTVPAAPVIDSLAGLAQKFPEEVGEALTDLATACRGIARSSDEIERLARIEQIRTDARSSDQRSAPRAIS
jgi:hypothetical protein